MLVALALLSLVVRQSPDVCPDRRFGCVILEPGDPLIVGTLLVTTGENATLGIDSRHGAILAIEARGPVLGRPVKLIHQDDGCDAAIGERGAIELTRTPDLVAVIGTSCSSAAIPAARVLGEQGILMISPSNTGPQMTEPGARRRFYARTAPNDRQQAIAMAVFARRELSARTGATITNLTPYADAQTRLFAQTFRDLGGTITGTGTVPEGATPAQARAALMRIGEPDLVYFPIFVEEAASVVRAARSLPALASSELAAGDPAFTPDFLDAAGFENVAGVLVSNAALLPFGDSQAYGAFENRYERRFGEEPQSVFHAHAYDAANLLFDALERTAIRGRDGSILIPRTGLRDALLDTEDRQGLTGSLTCDRFGDCGVPTNVPILRIEDHGETWSVTPSGEIGPGPALF